LALKAKPPSLLEAFANLDQPVKDALADIQNPLMLGLATLVLAEDKAQRQYLSGEHIVAALESAGVAIQRTQITRSFSRAGNRISRKVVDGETHYRVMTHGRRDVEFLLKPGKINVSYIEVGQPRTARKILQQIMKSVSGEVKICDPYYGLRTLDALEMIPTTCKVQFLTAQTNEKPAKLSGPIIDFKRERPKTEMRLFPNPKALHDRYILTSDTLLILGHGIKDIGNKESFVISIAAEYAADLLVSISKIFDERWVLSAPL
jgi:hypothetical protein